MTTRSWIRKLFTRPVTRPIRKTPRRTRPALEALEERCCPNAYTVFNTLDDGSVGSLRWAVNQANTNPGADTINFDPDVFSTAQTITLSGSQLELSDKSGMTTITAAQTGTITRADSSTQFTSSAFIGSDPESIIEQPLTLTSGADKGASVTITDFDPGTGTFTFAPTIPGDFQAGDTFTVGAAAGVTISGGGLSRVFQVDSQVAASFSGLTITDGTAAAGGGLYNLGTVTLTGCTLSGNSATSSGGGLDNSGTQSQAFLTNCTISGNSVAGAAQSTAQTGTVTTTDSTTQFSSSDFMGSMDNFIGQTLTFTSGADNGQSATVTKFDSTTGTFTFASAFSSAFQVGDAFTVDAAIPPAAGGGLANGGKAMLSNCTISGNSVASGAAQGPARTGTVTTALSTTQFTSSAFINTTDHFIGQTLNFTSGTDKGKSATVTNFDPTTGTFTFAPAFSSAFQVGDAFTVDAALTTVGGGLLSTGTTQLLNTIVAGNTAPTAPDVSGTVISGGFNLIGKTDGSSGWFSSAAKAGDAFTVHAIGTVTTAPSTTQFTSSAFIGAKDNFTGQTLTFTSGADKGQSATVTKFDPTTGTFTFASAFSSAFQDGDTFTVNATGNIAKAINTTQFTSSAFIGTTDNFIGQTLTFTSGADKGQSEIVTNFDSTTGTFTFAPAFSSAFQAGDLTGTIANPLDPVLGPLANNGGPTQTMALLTGSPAINAGPPLAFDFQGNPLPTDQRGFARVGSVDIGAFESNVQPQFIDFAPLPEATYGKDFQIFAPASSGLSVSFTATGDATVSQIGSSDVWNVHPTGVGSATITAHQAGDAAFSAAPNVTQPLTIGEGIATIHITPYTLAYDGTAHTATGTATGVGGVDLSADLNFSGTTHTNPDGGSGYTDSWTFHDSTGTYQDATGTITDSIGKANATVVVTPYTSDSTTYDGLAHTATLTSITGVNGQTGVAVGTVDVSGTTHTNAGTYSDKYVFTGTAFYNSATLTITDSIGQAQATIQVTPYTSAGTAYDGTAHTATGTATGIGGVDLSSDLDLSGTTNTDAGTYTDTWKFHDVGGNYQDASGTITDSIAQASALVLVKPYNAAYDGNPHTATGLVIGVGGLLPSSDLDLSGTTHTNSGFYAGDVWKFHDASGNYQDASGTITDSIAQNALTVQPTDWMGQLADGLPLTDISLPGTYNSASGPSVADALFGDSSASVVGQPDALTYAAQGLHLTAAIADGVAIAAIKLGVDNPALDGAAILANASASAADVAAGVTDAASGLALTSDITGLLSDIADAVQAKADASSEAANTAATAPNSAVAGPNTAAATEDGLAGGANGAAETANATAGGGEAAAEFTNGEAGAADEAAKDADEAAADQGAVDPVADGAAAGADEFAVTEDGLAVTADGVAAGEDADAKGADGLAEAQNEAAVEPNTEAAAANTAAEATDSAAASANGKAAFVAGASATANTAASIADGLTAGAFSTYANEINPANTNVSNPSNAAEQATLYNLAVTEASAHTAASLAEGLAATADGQAAIKDAAASRADSTAATAVTGAAEANEEATTSDEAADAADDAAVEANTEATAADAEAKDADGTAAGLDATAEGFDSAAAEADTEAAAADAEAATLDAEAIAADAAAPIADAAAVAADAAAVTADGVAAAADIAAAAQLGLDPVADGIAVAADVAAASLDAAATAADAAAVAADAAVVADDAAALAADGEAAIEDGKAATEDGLAEGADQAAVVADQTAEAKDAEAAALDAKAVSADEAAATADATAEAKDEAAAEADTEATNACEQANEANAAATEASEKADQLNDAATAAGAAATAADIAFTQEVAKVQGTVSTVQTQNASIADQLNAGIRSLDLRGTLVNDTIDLNDGQYSTGVTLQDALNDMTSFLQAHPAETIVVSLKSNENAPVNSVNSFNTDLNNLLNSQDTAVSGHTYNDFMYYSSNPTTTPTLGQVRGKIVIVPDAGDPWTPTANPVTGQTLGWTPTQVVQDSPTVSDAAARWNLAENNGDNTAGLIPTDLGNQNTLYRNNLSVTSTTTAQPTVDLGSTVNAIAEQAFTSSHVTRTTGIVGMDNPDANVTSAIINQNNLPIMVTSPSDALTGDPGNLRAAITEANSQPGVNTIEFAPNMAGQTIILLSDLPAITGDLNIVGPATIVTQHHLAFQHAATHTVLETDFVASDSGPLTPTTTSYITPIFVNTSALTIYVTVTQQKSVELEGQINALVTSGVLSSGNGNALLAKLSSAAANFASGSPNTGSNDLHAFINQVNDFASSTPPLLTTAQAQTLINAANAIITLANPLQLSVVKAADGTFSLTVTAIDVYGNVLPTFTGTVNFADSVTGATLPGKYTFTSNDNGVHTFTGLVLNNGLQTLTITDAKTKKVLGTVTVNVD